jgi:4-alpha-glucanotransferase
MTGLLRDGYPTGLAALANAHGVAVGYEGAGGEPVAVPPDTIRAVLAAMDIEAGNQAAIRAALREAELMSWRRVVEPTVVAPADARAAFPVTTPGTGRVEVTLVTATGEHLPLALDPVAETRTVEGVPRARRRVRVPAGVPVGTHRVLVQAVDDVTAAHLLVVPAACPVREGLHAWGWQVQLYALRSRESWGMGDLGDLAHLVRISGSQHGAGLVLLNPLHAALPVLPQEPSPYYPASRRFTNPLYLRVEHCDGYAGLPPAARGRVDALAAEARRDNTSDRINRDIVFRRKMEAFELLAAQPLGPERQLAYVAYLQAEGQGLIDFATAAALAERHGRSFHDWPAPLRDPRGDAVAAARVELSDRIGLHTWLQWQCDEQLAAAESAAGQAGMPVGLITDLAVGVNPGGADAWALQADLAQGVTVGAPPDSFNRHGQDWRLPPLRPDRLPVTGYAPFRDLLRSQLRHAGGIRVDHVMGLFRLFWIPDGAAPSDGTYVRYPAEALLGVLALEAQAAGAVVVGEDLGTVERGVRATLRQRGVYGSRVVWFEREASVDYPELALASVTTHDLPTAAGFLASEPIRVRAALGLLQERVANATRSTSESKGDLPVERARHAARCEELLALLQKEGLLDIDSSDPESVVAALHAFIARTPSALVTASLGDGVGDLRQPNLPGTTDEYPNWRLPVAEPVGEPPTGLLPPSRPVLLDELLTAPGVQRLAALLTEGRNER